MTGKNIYIIEYAPDNVDSNNNILVRNFAHIIESKSSALELRFRVISS